MTRRRLAVLPASCDTLFRDCAHAPPGCIFGSCRPDGQEATQVLCGSVWGPTGGRGSWAGQALRGPPIGVDVGECGCAEWVHCVRCGANAATKLSQASQMSTTVGWVGKRGEQGMLCWVRQGCVCGRWMRLWPPFVCGPPTSAAAGCAGSCWMEVTHDEVLMSEDAVSCAVVRSRRHKQLPVG